VRLLARRQRIEWNAQSKPRPLLRRMLEPDAGVASGWKSFAISELPRTFRWMFAPAKRHGFVADAYGPSGAWWLRDRVDGKISIALSARINAATVENGRVRLQFAQPDGICDVTTDHVVAATGFRTDIDQLGYLASNLKRQIRREAAGIPALSSQFETSVPGLFIVGVASAPVFGPIMRFMYGAKHAAPIVTSRLAAA
jgi:FAD-dependent urate hydroxylase